MSDTTKWIIGIVLGLLLLSRSRTARGALPGVPAITHDEAMDLFGPAVAKWHDEASVAEDVTSALETVEMVPADLTLVTILHESSGDPNVDHGSGEHGLGGLTQVAVEDVVQNALLPSEKPRPADAQKVLEDLNSQFDPSMLTDSSEVVVIALYLGLLKARHDTWLGAFEAYRCGPDRSAEGHDCHGEAIARLEDANREPNLTGDPHA